MSVYEENKPKLIELCKVYQARKRRNENADAELAEMLRLCVAFATPLVRIYLPLRAHHHGEGAYEEFFTNVPTDAFHRVIDRPNLRPEEFPQYYFQAVKNGLLSAVRHVGHLKRQSLNGSPQAPGRQDDDSEPIFDGTPAPTCADMANGDAIKLMLELYLRRLKVRASVPALQCYVDTMAGLSQPESAQKRGIHPSAVQRRIAEVQKALAAVNRDHHELVDIIDLDQLSVDLAAQFVTDLQSGIQRIINEKEPQVTVR